MFAFKPQRDYIGWSFSDNKRGIKKTEFDSSADKIFDGISRWLGHDEFFIRFSDEEFERDKGQRFNLKWLFEDSEGNSYLSYGHTGESKAEGHIIWLPNAFLDFIYPAPKTLYMEWVDVSNV